MSEIDFTSTSIARGGVADDFPESGLKYSTTNEGVSHGHALAFTTTIAHKFNDSKFYSRFLKIVKKLGFKSIKLQSNFQNAADLILTDKKHLDNNPKLVSREDIVLLLEKINSNNVLN